MRDQGSGLSDQDSGLCLSLKRSGPQGLKPRCSYRIMYGLKPVPFKIMYGLKPVPFKLRRYGARVRGLLFAVY
jgi:hypothetical protein